MKLWGANIVRVPFNQDWVLNGSQGVSAEQYLTYIDDTIEYLRRSGVYTLLDLHWLDDRREFGGIRQFVPPLPDPNSIAAWQTLAKRYGKDPAVLFDIFNEPHDRTLADPYPLWRPDGTQYPPDHRRVSLEEWQPWAECLIDTIRAEAPETLLFVSGTDWGYNLQGFPLDRANVVYSSHVYRDKGTNWHHAFGHLAEVAPVFAGELGGEEEDVDWGETLLDYLEYLGIGWAAWSYSDQPRLVTPDGVATPFGRLIQGRLSGV